MTNTKTPADTGPPHPDTPLEACRGLVSRFVDERLPEFFRYAGAVLLQGAERAESDAAQGRLFEAIGLIARHRSDIEHVLRQELDAGFQRLWTKAPHTRDSGPDPSHAKGAKLSLVEPDDIEESVAAANLIARANGQYFPELYALNLRLSNLTGRRTLKDDEIPAGPHHLIHSFRRALDGLDVEIEIKLTLYASFNKSVIQQCRGVYSNCNQTLQAAGVLPDLTPAYVRTVSSQTQPTDQPGNAQSSRDAREPAAPMDEEFGSDAELLASILSLMSVGHSPEGGGGGRTGDAGEPHPITPERAAAAIRQVLLALNDAQAQVAHARGGSTISSPRPYRGFTPEPVAHTDGGNASGEHPNAQIEADFLDRFRATLPEERQRILEQVDRDDLPPMDADLIDLIGMLFEYMLNDPVLPSTAKALLSHLHTPYLKVALIDQRLLNDSTHPARQLLDQMVEAGSLWVEEGQPSRGIFPMMQETVDRVLEEFTDDVKLFEELSQDFKRAMQAQQRRTDIVEQRAQEAARGRERLQVAKQLASKHVQALIERHPVPTALSQFLGSTWLDRLVFIVLRESDGIESRAWDEALSTARDLLGLFDPELGPSDRQTRIERIPELRRAILREVELMGSYSRATMDGLWSLLDSPTAGRPQDLPSTAQTAADIREPGAPSTAQGQAQPDTATQTGLSGPQQEVIARLSELGFGNWFEFTPLKGGPARRVKLSWMSPQTSTCMFVDRAGMLVEIKTLSALADEMLSGQVRVIARPKHPFIERALVSIRKLLQSKRHDPAGASP